VSSGPELGVRRAYLGLGSNLDDRFALLQGAVDALVVAEGVTVVAVSPVYETDPVGPDQPDYLNAVVGVDTALSARALLELAQSLEADAHRVRRERWGPRTLDVDVLLVADERVREPDLEVPHPRLHERAFVRVPLADIAPDIEAALPGTIDPRDAEGVRPTDLRLVVTQDP
jgi:2-amino-4-hydroxy-6-hydroxymethyldihydropteridine diphosphokinase